MGFCVIFFRWIFLLSLLLLYWWTVLPSMICWLMGYEDKTRHESSNWRCCCWWFFVVLRKIRTWLLGELVTTRMIAVQTKLYSFRFDCKIVSFTAANTNLIFSVSKNYKNIEIVSFFFCFKCLIACLSTDLNDQSNSPHTLLRHAVKHRLLRNRN